MGVCKAWRVVGWVFVRPGGWLGGCLKGLAGGWVGVCKAWRVVGWVFVRPGGWLGGCL